MEDGGKVEAEASDGDREKSLEHGHLNVTSMEKEQQGDSSLHTVAIILLCCGAVKMLHLLGVISVEGESVLRALSSSTDLIHRVGRRWWKFSGFSCSRHVAFTGVSC